MKPSQKKKITELIVKGLTPKEVSEYLDIPQTTEGFKDVVKKAKIERKLANLDKPAVAGTMLTSDGPLMPANQTPASPPMRALPGIPEECPVGKNESPVNGTTWSKPWPMPPGNTFIREDIYFGKQ